MRGVGRWRVRWLGLLASHRDADSNRSSGGNLRRLGLVFALCGVVGRRRSVSGIDRRRGVRRVDRRWRVGGIRWLRSWVN